MSSKQRAFLRGLAHDLEPLVLVGHRGITQNLLAEVASALLAHELIKVRLAEGDVGGEAEIAKAVRAAVIARVGRVAILYKPHPHKPRIKLPRIRRKRPEHAQPKQHAPRIERGTCTAAGARDSPNA